MHTEARLPVEDVDGTGLAFTAGAAGGIHVAATNCQVLIDDHQLQLQLQVLAASHRITEVGGATLETVACRTSDDQLFAPFDTPQPTGELQVLGLQSADRQWNIGRWNLHMVATLLCTSPDNIARTVKDLRADTEHEGLLVQFPGHDDAVTAVLPAHDGWQTWHTYPQHDPPHVVITQTTVAARQPTAATTPSSSSSSSSAADHKQDL